jgi:CubicO group peptidase (beta-lactamase class C family)
MTTNCCARIRVGYWLGFPLLLAVLLLPVGCSSKSSTGPDMNEASLAYQLSLLTSKQHVPGALGALWTRNGLTDIQAAGVRRAGYPDKMTIGDYMFLGSLGKFMTSTMIGRLIDEGKLAWTTRPGDVFPDLASTIDPAYRDVTLLDLLRHRAGVPASEDFGTVPQLTGSLREQREQVVNMVLSVPPAVPRGTYRYSNIGYAIAAAMAEKVMNRDWRSLMDENLFQPLGITPVYGWPVAHDPDEPWGHEWTSSGFMSMDASVDAPLMFLEPAGFISLTLEDYSKFIRLHMDALAGQPRILSAATFDTLHTPVEDYACGMTVLTGGAYGPLYWHNGSNGYFYAALYLLPEKDLAIALAVNAEDSSLSAAVTQAANAVLEPRISRK